MGMVYRKKLRGAKRKLDKLLYYLDFYTQEFPSNNVRNYWHLHMPCSNILLDSLKTPSFVKRRTVQKIVEVVEKLIQLKPYNDSFYKVVGVITLPDLSQSQIIVFFDKEYYDHFFDRNTEEQRWEELEHKKAKEFVKRFGIENAKH